MKIINKLLCFASVGLLAGCNKVAPYEHDLSIICPTGAPAVAFYNYALDEKFETNSADMIKPLMVNGKKDVVVLPTNVGISLINKQAPYKIAATITFGNIYVAATGNDGDGVMDADDYIVLFQQGSVPDLVFHYVYGDSLNSGIHYVEKSEYAAACLKTGINAQDAGKPSVDYVLLAEPAITKVLSETTGRSVYADLQAKYKEKSNGLDMFQASVFIKNELSKEKAESFLVSLEKDIKDGIEDPNKIKEGLDKADDAASLYGTAGAMAKKVTENGNKLGLGFKRAKENKASIDNFLSLFSIAATNEEIYY